MKHSSLHLQLNKALKYGDSNYSIFIESTFLKQIPMSFKFFF